MPETAIFRWAVIGVLVAAALTFVALFWVTAPYGRHLRSGWGPTLPATAGWVIMESPAVLLFAAVYFRGSHAGELVPLVLLALWQLHYLNRTFVYPFRMRAAGRRMPVAIAAMAIGFNCVNAWINALWISELGTYAASWLLTPQFLLGAGLFVIGFAINQHADAVLRRLRAPGETGYRIPEGGLYRWVSCPNYLGEILEWAGWAIAAWSPAGAAFAVFTVANLAPRAIANHRWYRQQFADYPRRRRALIPGIV